jgi:Fic family protein
MKVPPAFSITNEMLQILAKIDANREIIAAQQPPPHIVERIQRKSVLKSSLFSAKIEGNTLNLKDISLTDEEVEQKEIQNILTAIQYISTHISLNKRITKTLIKELHTITLAGIRGDAGHFRTEVSAIFNQAGVAIYMPPPPQEIHEHIENLCSYINSQREEFPLVKACIAHLIIEKIHPFLDGNGRVGRLLIYAVLQSQGYQFGVHVPFEEYLDRYRDAYYYHLDIGMREVEVYLVFMLRAFYEQTNQIKESVLKDTLPSNQPVLLPPRQDEIRTIIADHKMVTFDFVRRRFMKVPERTLRYDLKKMCDAGVLVKVGKTRGAYYAVKNE